MHWYLFEEHNFLENQLGTIFLARLLFVSLFSVYLLQTGSEREKLLF